MRIGYVAEPYEESNASGMGYVVLEFMRQLASNNEGHVLTVFSSKSINKEFVPGTYENVLIPSSLLGKLWWSLRLKNEIDALLFVVPLLPFSVSKRIKTIPICQELYVGEITPKSFYDRALSLFRDRILMKACISRAEKIISPSLATKNDIIDFYKVDEKKVVLIPDGYQEISKSAALESHIPESKPFFFFAGKIKVRKNVQRIVEGFVKFKDRTKADCKLIIAGDGSGSYYEQIQKTVHESGYVDDVRFVGYVSGTELHSYYKHALALVYPSLHEGFGMPILEAMSLGVPVITSNTSSMPEVAGDAALLVDPDNSVDIGSAMEKVWSNSVVRDELSKKGKERAAQFSWERSGRELLNLLGDISKNK